MTTTNNQPNDYTRRTLHGRGICVVIPTYNNVGSIRRVVTEVQAYCNDIIVVNDGSDDGTADILKSIKDITLVSYPKNRGKGYALKQGFTRALQLGFAYAITMDADGQHSATDIPAFLGANKQWPGSLILGNRNKGNIVRSKGSNFANSFSNFWFCVQTFHHLPDTQTGFRLYPLKKLYGYQLITSRYEAELELLVFASWNGVAIHSIPVNVYYPPKEERVSHFRPGLDFTRISILNTCLCFLAIVYGLPAFLLRTIAKAIRTLTTFLMLFVVVLIFWPTLFLYTHIRTMNDHRRWHLHLLMYLVMKLMTIKVGIPGAKFQFKANKTDDFDEPSIIICNHQSHLDLLCLLAMTPKIVFLTNDWVWHSPIFGFLIHNAEYYPASDGIDNILPHFHSLISRGYSIAIFPEGTRSADCKVARFHQGAFYAAEKLGIGIKTILLYGTGRVLPKKKYTVSRSPVYIEVGKSYSPDELKQIGEPRQQAKFFHHLYLDWFEKVANKIEQNV